MVAQKMLEKSYILGKAFFLVLVLGLPGFLIFNFFFAKRPEVEFNSPVSSFSADRPTDPEAISPPVLSSGLALAVAQALTGTHGQYGIVIKNLKTGEGFELNSHQVFPSASLYKVWVMVIVFEKIADGSLSMDTEISGNVVDLNKKFDIDEESAELTEGGFTFTVEQAMEKMITVSHNYAALMLTEKIGLTSVNKFLRENGFFESKVGTGGSLPTTTPADMALFFEKLYGGKLAGPEETKLMMEVLKRQQMNYALPKYLPEGVMVAHKTGNIDEYTHDGGIVFAPSGDYVIVEMTKSDSRTGAEERMAQVSKAAWEWFAIGD